MAISYEDRMFGLLTERLTGGPDETGGPEEAGHVVPLSAQGAVVKAAGRPDVRVTMKAAAVSVKDVEDFEREVESAGGHGIICGEDCAVAQRSAVGFRLIKPGGGFVFHLANVGDDADMLVEYLRVIYGLESRRSDGSVRSGMRAGEYDELLTTGVRWVQEICKRYVDKVEVTKVAMTMGVAKAAMEAGLRAVYDISLMLPREAGHVVPLSTASLCAHAVGVLSSPLGCAGHVGGTVACVAPGVEVSTATAGGVVKAGAPPRCAFFAIKRLSGAHERPSSPLACSHPLPRLACFQTAHLSLAHVPFCY